MEHVLAPLFTVMQATLMGIGLILLVPLVVIPIQRWPSEPRFRQRLLWVIGLIAPWVLLAYWTSFHWHQDGTPSVSPPLAGPIALATLVASLLLAVAGIILNRGARWFFAAWGIANVWFAAVGALLCIMATSGNWI